MNPQVQDMYYSLSVGGNFFWGEDAEVEVSIGIGWSSSTPDQMGGLEIGVNLTAAFYVGLTGSLTFAANLDGPVAFKITPEAWTFVIAPSFGIGAGLTGTIGYSLLYLYREIPKIARQRLD